MNQILSDDTGSFLIFQIRFRVCPKDFENIPSSVEYWTNFHDCSLTQLANLKPNNRRNAKFRDPEYTALKDMYRHVFGRRVPATEKGCVALVAEAMRLFDKHHEFRVIRRTKSITEELVQSPIPQPLPIPARLLFMIYENPRTQGQELNRKKHYQIKSGGQMRPALYDKRKAAEYANRFPEETLLMLHETVNVGQGRLITYADLKEHGI